MALRTIKIADRAQVMETIKGVPGVRAGLRASHVLRRHVVVRSQPPRGEGLAYINIFVAMFVHMRGADYDSNPGEYSYMRGHSRGHIRIRLLRSIFAGPNMTPKP